MQCYICRTTHRPEGTLYGVRPAIGVCRECGVGVCVEHACWGEAPVAPLLCPTHARVGMSQTPTVSEPMQGPEVFGESFAGADGRR
jgi:hypothetical protein